MTRGSLSAAAAVVLASLPWPAPVGAACGEPGPRPRVGLVLSGGGARGIAHVGVLKALEEQGVRPDCIAGTSMGALIGALYSSGYSATRIETIVGSVDWQRIYSGRAERPLVPVARRLEEMRPLVRLGFGFWDLRLPRAAEPDYRLRRFLVALLTAPAVRAGRDFDHLPIPFRAVATDLATGERVVLGVGSLEAAVRASISAPVTLEPVRDQGHWLVDGGIVDNMPVGVARDMGADVVIAVDTRSPPVQPGAESDVVEVANALADVLMRRRNEDFRAEADVVVRPALQGFANTDYPAYQRAIAAGYAAARTQAAALRAALPSRAQSATVRTNGAPDAGTGPLPSQPVADVRVDGLGTVRKSLVLEAFGMQAGRPFDLPEALRGLDAVWATRLFRSAWLDVIPAAQGLTVVVHVREAERRLLEVSAAFDETDKADGVVRLRDANVFGRGETLELLGRASQARTALHLGFSVDGLRGSPLGYFVQAGVSEWRPRRFVAGKPLPRAEFDRRALEGGLQTHPWPALLLRTRIERAHVGTAADSEAGLLAGGEEIATMGALALWDTLDDRWEPTRGGMASIEFDHSVAALGSTHDYWRALGTGRAAATLGRAGTVQVDVLGFTSGGAIPLHEQVQFGGPALAPGLPRDGLWGPHGGALALSHRIAVVRGFQLVARAGVEGVWAERSSITLGSAQRGFGFGLRHASRAGPLSLEWGRAEGRSQVYIGIGYPLPP